MGDCSPHATDQEMYPERHGARDKFRLPTDAEVTLLIDLVINGPIHIELISDKTALEGLEKLKYVANVIVNRNDDYYAATAIGSGFFCGLHASDTLEKALEKALYNYPT
jgi:hypothetical protein